MEKLLKFLPLSCFLLGILFSIIVDGCYHSHFEPKFEPETQRDTIYLHDTLKLEIGIPKREIVKDYVYVPVHDTLTLKDTLFLELPITEKLYQDSTYTAKVSGYRPSLDYLEIYQNERIIRETVTRTVPVKLKPKFSVGIQGGYGATKEGLSPYIGVGLQYNILSFGYK